MLRLKTSLGLIVLAGFVACGSPTVALAAHGKPAPKVQTAALACLATDGSLKITNNGSRGWGAFDRIDWKAGRLTGSFGAPVNWQKGSSLMVSVSAAKKGIACTAWVPAPKKA